MMKLYAILFFALLMLLMAFLACAPRVVGPDIEGLVRQSRFIFKGTIKQMNAATMPIVQVTDSTAIVKVDEVIEAPATLADLTSQEITVQLRKSQTAKVGQQGVFFTNGWLYGSSIAVVEVGRIEAQEDTTNMRKKVAEASRKISDQDLQKRLARAELVIVGKVSSTRATEPTRRGPITEHEPDWWEATIQVESVEKGQLPEKIVAVLFPNSTDELWIESPKFRPGQEGIWILQRNQQEKGWPILRRSGLTALDVLDFQTKDQLERIRRLIRSSR